MERLQLAVLNLDFDSSQEKSTQAMASMLESSGSSELMSTMPWLRAKLSRCAKLMWVDIHLWRTRNSTSLLCLADVPAFLKIEAFCPIWWIESRWVEYIFPHRWVEEDLRAPFLCHTGAELMAGGGESCKIDATGILGCCNVITDQQHIGLLG